MNAVRVNVPGGGAASAGAEPESEDVDKLVTALEGMGARVYLNDHGETDGDNTTGSSVWGSLMGYEAQKREIEDTLLLALLRPEVYDAVAAGTRKDAKDATNRPRALLFEGPPGTGKTSAAKAIAAHASVALIYVPLEAVASKYYGESERLLAQVFQLCDRLEGAVVFLDEVDALAQTRGGEMHEATRRLLSVLLRRIDGLDSRGRTVVVAATNRKQDLDPALVSRFDAAIEFGLPTEPCRGDIMGCYAKHLTMEELAAVARATGGMSGRDLRDVAEATERRWASKIIRGVVGGSGSGAGRGGKTTPAAVG
jgi:ATP-dependent 26S proteasome regulatory subunit